eukprot:GAHX01001575.1.p1 GENE.GAHX01001575.1~~GAHX01001575.1.p1  ORF type:complete len:404 (-),score=51.53 GAHX01001575.1:48-1259(-)
MVKTKRLPNKIPHKPRQLHSNEYSTKNTLLTFILIGLIFVAVVLIVSNSIPRNKKKTFTPKEPSISSSLSSSSDITKTLSFSDEMDKSILFYYNKLYAIITSFGLKNYNNDSAEFSSRVADLVNNKTPELEDFIQEVGEKAATLTLHLYYDRNKHENIMNFYSCIFDLLILLNTCYDASNTSKGLIESMPYSRQKKAENIYRFVFQNFFLKYITRIMFNFINCGKRIIFDLYKEHMLTLGTFNIAKETIQIEEGSLPIYNILRGFVYLFERIKTDMFSEGLFNIEFTHDFTLSVKFLLNSIDTFVDFLILNFSLIFTLLFDLDRNGKIVTFKLEAYNAIVRMNNEGENMDIEEWIRGVFEKCTEFGGELKNYRDGTNSKYYLEFVEKNGKCLAQLYKLKRNNN